MSIRAEIEIFINNKFEVEIAPLQEEIAKLQERNKELSASLGKVGKHTEALIHKQKEQEAMNDEWSVRSETKEAELRNFIDETVKGAKKSAMKTALMITLVAVIPLAVLGYLVARQGRTQPVVEQVSE
ncbi:hypothetical protein BVY04_00050 [bacterium M21]|nr:hypothetical protein BVY04_00050 [bacterium M21]